MTVLAAIVTTTEPTKPCTVCGKSKALTEYYRDSKTRDGRKACCKQCHRSAQAEHYKENKHEILARRAKARANRLTEENALPVTLLYCPVDAELGIPLFPVPASFTRGQFKVTLAKGNWPDGAIFEYALEYQGERTQWRVIGTVLVELDTGRVSLADFGKDTNARVSLLDAVISA